MDKAAKKYQTSLIYLALAVVTLAVYWPVHKYHFLNYDDPEYVTANLPVAAGLTHDGLIWASSTGHAGNWHPITWLSHMLDCELFGLDAGRHHLTSLLLHIANTLLLFALLRSMTAAAWPAAFVAAAFALHPLHVESVAWLAERKDVLSTLFWMLTILVYVRYVKAPDAVRYLLVLLTFAAGLMIKPMLVTLPLVLLLLDYWPLGRFESNTKSPGARSRRRVLFRLVCEKIPLFILAAISSVVTFLVQQSSGAVIKSQSIPLTGRIANALVSYVTYIEKMFLPRNLAVFYPHPLETVPVWHVFFAVVFLLAVSLFIIRFARTAKFLLTGWLWFLITLLPVIGIVQAGSQAWADRYSYLPLTGLFIIIAWGLDRFAAKVKFPKAAIALLALAAVSGLSICTRLQLRHWRNSETLFRHALQATQGNYVAHYHLAWALSRQQRIDEAVMHLRETLRLRPAEFGVMNTLALLLAVHNQAELHNPQEAIALAKRACQSADYKNPAFLDTLAISYAAAGRFDEAIETAEKALFLATVTRRGALAENIQTRLLLYRTGQPYFETVPEASLD